MVALTMSDDEQRFGSPLPAGEDTVAAESVGEATVAAADRPMRLSELGAESADYYSGASYQRRKQVVEDAIQTARQQLEIIEKAITTALRF